MSQEAVIFAVALAHGVSVSDVLSKTRRARIVRARHVAMFIARRLLTYSLNEIGEVFGRDHASVMHAVGRVMSEMNFCPAFKAEVEGLMERMKREPRVRVASHSEWDIDL